MNDRTLVIGGAGFIGSHLVDALLAAGHTVTVFDNLEPQVHGGLRERGEWPDYLAGDCAKILGDIRDKGALAKALAGQDVVYHQAAAVGVGQSMYEIERYVDVNTRGTATLLQLLANGKHNVRKLVVASSMSIYGEGKYACVEHGDVYPQLRPEAQLAARDWEMRCPHCGRRVAPQPTDEDKPLHSTSIYAVTKKTQEEMCLIAGRAYNIPTVALRYFNVYGARQALTNPYTGVGAIFCGSLLNNQPPLIYEDGRQSRDLTHVSDIVQANMLALERKEMDYGAFNVGTGVATTILDIARTLIDELDSALEPEIVNKFRAGDIRHCVADITRIQALGYRVQMPYKQGLAQWLQWVRSQVEQTRANAANVAQAQQELIARGLTV
jgi:dTDP-L-rhamnose 4-epimerase